MERIPLYQTREQWLADNKALTIRQARLDRFVLAATWLTFLGLGLVCLYAHFTCPNELVPALDMLR
jgi:hypothetical protein